MNPHNYPSLGRQNQWELTVHDWLHCVAAGVQPVKSVSFSDDGPQFYRTTEILFSHPPMRADFLSVVATTPWMQVWEKDLLPVIADNPWPMIDYAHKAADVTLKDTQGREVGRLEVKRETMVVNHDCSVPFISFDLVKCSARLPQAKWNEAWDYIEKHRYEIMEAVVLKGPESVSIGLTNREVSLVIRKFLVKGGFLKKA